MEIVSMSYVLGLLGLVSLVILGLLFVVYCHETGLKLNPKLSSEGRWRVVWSFLQSFWRSGKEIRELKREIEYVLKYIRSDKYEIKPYYGICVIAIDIDYYCTFRKFLTIYKANGYWWPPHPSVSVKEAARPRILYLKFLLKNIHLVHELLKLNEKIEGDESLSVSELDRKRYTFLYNYLHHSQIK